MSATLAIARLNWKRMLRGRALWVTLLLLLVPIGVALLALLYESDPRERWTGVATISLRALVLLAPILHLSTAISEENDGKTYTYLCSRPVPRQALILGKMLAVTPVTLLLAAAALSVAFAIIATGPGEADVAMLLRALAASAAGVIAASCFAVGVGALVPRHPMVVALGWILFGEQILSFTPAVQNLSVLFHVHAIAELQGVDMGGDGALPAYLGLLLLSAFWLGVAMWRVRKLEFGSAEG